ncbi:uncharacterized protein BJ171DRAFT_444054 [Polychytrium aggregatum]|uniref:uncharacterized protein n=1 Tax=Polychytrium aggregatum TaxID=110093 RepID=UPI0022FE8DB8|nr:uncharacterized protein BJ171DRAFT_444054 [Polychytrium aggregatum]KAI9202873.1 hypothetical protein BJ171DRAFT_444054 [Polychytrium aggregatum]
MSRLGTPEERVACPFQFELEIAAFQPSPGAVASRIAIFDFDSTLFRSPNPNPDLWTPTFQGAIKGDCSWFAETRTLDPPYVPDQPDSSWWDAETVKEARRSIADPSSATVLMTGRRRDVYYDRIKSLCSFLNPSLDFDFYFMREGDDTTQPRYFVATLDYKLCVIETLLGSPQFAHVRHIDIYDDRKNHIRTFAREMEVYKKLGRIDSFEVVRVLHDADLNVCMPVELERTLVLDLVRICNEKTQRAKQQLQEQSQAQSVPTLDGRLARSNKKIISAAAFREQIELVDEVYYTAVFLTDESQELLKARFPRPPLWTTYCHHMTICLGQCQDDAVEKLGGLGALVRMQAVAVGSIEDKVMAVRVESVPGERPIQSKNEVPHITLYVHPDTRAKTSNDITEWQLLETPLRLEGRVGEKVLTGMANKAKSQTAKAVSIGDLILKHHPTAKGPAIGKLVAEVERWMSKGFVENSEGNRAEIELFIVQHLDARDITGANGTPSAAS